MHPDITHISGMDDLEHLLSESHTRPLVLFKHSDTCGISAEALDALVDHVTAGLGTKAGINPTYAVVTVQTHREVSNAVTAKLGVRHETPQALLIRDGRVVWSASHFRVTADAVQRALNGAAR